MECGVSNIHIDLRLYRWIFYAFCAGAVACAIASMHSDQCMASLLFIATGLAFLYLAQFFGTYVISNRYLTYSSRLGKWRISWSEILSAQCSPAGTLLLLGDNKHFPLTAPSLWPRSCREQAFQFVSEQLRTHKIVPSLNRLADYRWMKNVRVRRE